MTDNELESYAKDLELQLVRTRKHPFKTAWELLVFNFLVALLSRKSVIPWSMASRFSRSAAKRSPHRSLVLNDSKQITVQQGFLIKRGELAWEPERPIAVVVTHEGSRTGAPILAFNLGKEFSKRYNVITIVLGPGTMMDAFRECGTEVLFSDRRSVRSRVYHDMMKHIMAQGEVAFAVVNSVESSVVLPAMKAAGLKVVTLIHEFASYTQNREKVFCNILGTSTATVFSSPLTLENAIENGVMSRSDNVHVVPQGRCKVPHTVSKDSRQEEERLLKELRPFGAEGRFLVIGAGSVEFRKGLDLFIECANRLVYGPGGEQFDFVWFGGGYKPSKSDGYSVFLEDQIRRAGLSSRLRIVPPTSKIETAYTAADVFVLPSRLDPLPNVTIDAMSIGLPVVCFDQATGIAPILKESGLGDPCVARYLDTSDLSEKVRRLATDDLLLQTVRRNSMEAARARFDFVEYVAQVERLAMSPVSETVL